MPNEIDQSLFDELMRRSVQSPVPSHAPVTDLDVARTQIADIEARRRGGETMPGMPPVDRPLDLMLGILPIGSALRSPNVRAAMHYGLKKTVAQMPSHIQTGVHDFIKKYPRLTAHLKSITPQKPEDPASATTAALPRPPLAPQARIELNPRLMSREATRRSLQHEGTHVAQMLRLMDRTRHANPQAAAQPSAIFTETYDDLSRQMGYFKNPMEVAARVNRELLDIPRQTVGRRGIAQERAMDMVRQDINLAKDLGQRSLHSDREMVDQLIRQAIQAGKIPPSGQRRFTQVDTHPINIGIEGKSTLGPMPTSVSVPKGGTVDLIQPTTSTTSTIRPEEVEDLIKKLLKK